MPLNLASPGIVVREVDLTVGRVDTASDKVGALVGPFAKGAVDLPILVETEQDLLDAILENHTLLISIMSIGWLHNHILLMEDH